MINRGKEVLKLCSKCIKSSLFLMMLLTLVEVKIHQADFGKLGKHPLGVGLKAGLASPASFFVHVLEYQYPTSADVLSIGTGFKSLLALPYHWNMIAHAWSNRTIGGVGHRSILNPEQLVLDQTLFNQCKKTLMSIVLAHAIINHIPGIAEFIVGYGLYHYLFNL